MAQLVYLPWLERVLQWQATRDSCLCAWSVQERGNRHSGHNNWLQARQALAPACHYIIATTVIASLPGSATTIIIIGQTDKGEGDPAAAIISQVTACTKTCKKTKWFQGDRILFWRKQLEQAPYYQKDKGGHYESW